MQNFAYISSNPCEILIPQGGISRGYKCHWMRFLLRTANVNPVHLKRKCWCELTAWLDWTADFVERKILTGAKEIDWFAEDFLNAWGHPEYLRTSWNPEDILHLHSYYVQVQYVHLYTSWITEGILNARGHPECLRISLDPANSFQIFRINYEQTTSSVLFYNVIATLLFLYWNMQ